MGNITERKSLQLFLNYIGKPVKSILEIESKINADYNKDFSYHTNNFLSRMNGKYLIHKRPIEEVIFCSSNYAFNLFKKENNKNALTDMAIFFKDFDADIKLEHYNFLAEQYVKNCSANDKIKDIFFTLFDLKKFDKFYLACLGIATYQDFLTQAFTKINYKFSLPEYVYAHKNKNQLVIDSFELSNQDPIPYSKEIEVLFLHQIESLGTRTNFDFENLLIKFIHNECDCVKLKNTVIEHNKSTLLLSPDSMAAAFNSVFFETNKKTALRCIDKYIMFFNLSNSLNDKGVPKSLKI